MYNIGNCLSRMGSENDRWSYLNSGYIDNFCSWDVIHDIIIEWIACVELHSLPLVSSLYTDESHDQFVLCDPSWG